MNKAPKARTTDNYAFPKGVGQNSTLIEMQEISHKDYLEFVSKNDKVVI